MMKTVKGLRSFCDFREEVEELEKQYVVFLDSLPSHLAESGKRQFFERVKKRENAPCVMFYTPFWFADACDVKDQQAIKQIAMGTFFLYHFVTLKDDALDQQQTNAKEYVRLSNVMLEKSLEVFSQFAPKPKLIFCFNKLTHQWNRAERYLRKHQGEMTPYQPKDFQMMGEKSAMMKLCLPAFNGMKQQRPYFCKHIEQATNAAATGLQLMDDLSDWREDLDIQLYTYPLWMALSSHRRKVQNDQYVS